MAASSSSRFTHPPSPFTRCLHLDVLITVLIVCLVGFSATNLAASCNRLDRDSLVSFSSNIISRFPLNWNISVDCCAWEGVTCDINGRVTRLILPSSHIGGSIPPLVANLSHLSELNLSRNGFTDFPDGFFMSLNRLQIIDLSRNFLSGPLPTSDMLPATIKVVNFSHNSFNGTIQPVFLKQAINLESFDVSHNFFVGLVPTFICSISHSIRVLDFSFNRFSGSVPQDVGNCSCLETLRAGFNRLSGHLPKDIYKLSKLQELSFPVNNWLNGSLGNDIARLGNLRLLDLSKNEFSGVIPPEIGALSNLKQLFLGVNYFTGALPPSLTNCTRLNLVNLRANQLVGDLSKLNFSKFEQLDTVDLSSNFFNGSLPESLFTCMSLETVRLDSNNLTGQIPLSIQALQSLSYLSISNNFLTNVTGAVSTLSRSRSLRIVMLGKNFRNEFLPGDDSFVGSQGFRNLQLLDLPSCNLDGQIPSWLAKIPKLAYLDLSNNNLTGPIPSWLGSLPDLFHLDLSRNSLLGNFPPELTSLASVTREQEGFKDRHPVYSWQSSRFIHPHRLYRWLDAQLRYLRMSTFNSQILEPSILDFYIIERGHFSYFG